MISIIVPIYNSELYLERCLDSLAKLNNGMFEIILINDGSTDNSEKICEEYCKNYSVFKYYYQKNAGVSVARNEGVNLSEGEFICFVDSDDEVLSDELKSIEIDDEDVIYLDEQLPNTNLSKEELISVILNNSKFDYNFRSPWSKIYKKEILTKNRISFNTNLINGEDLIFNLEVVRQSKKIKFYKKNIYRYNINANSSTYSFSKKILSNEIEFYRCLDNYITAKNLVEKDILILNGAVVCINKYFFHRDNKASFNCKKKELKAFLKNEYYENASKNKVARKKLPLKNRIIWKLLQYRLYLVLYLLYCLFKRR